MNTEAQRNIGQAVQALIDRKAVGLVALEGAFAPIDVSRYRTFPDHETVRKVADYLLRKNEISGPVHTAFVSAQDIPPFIGIDDPTHHHANVAAYTASIPKVRECKQKLSEWQARTKRRKAAVFNSALQSFDEKVQAYHRGEISLGDYVKILTVTARELPPSVRGFVKALDAEFSLDFERAEKERTRLIQSLLRTLTKDQINTLMRRSTSYRLGQIPVADFYRSLRNLCEKGGVSLSRFPAMDAYVRYVLLADRIAGEKLFEDVADLEKARFALLAKTTEEKNLVNESALLFLTGKLVDFSLTQNEWKEYAVLQRTAAAPIPLNLASFEAFYKEAGARDGAMADNILAEMTSHKIDTAVMVTGGYHSTGITERLRRAGCAVVVFTPKIEKTPKGSSSLGVFTRQKTPLERMFSGQKLFLAADPSPPFVTKGLAAILAGLLRSFLLGDTNEAKKTFDALAGNTGESLSVTSIEKDGAVRARLVQKNVSLDLLLKTRREGDSVGIQELIQKPVEEQWYFALPSIAALTVLMVTGPTLAGAFLAAGLGPATILLVWPLFRAAHRENIRNAEALYGVPPAAYTVFLFSRYLFFGLVGLIFVAVGGAGGFPSLVRWTGLGQVFILILHSLNNGAFLPAASLSDHDQAYQEVLRGFDLKGRDVRYIPGGGGLASHPMPIVRADGGEFAVKELKVDTREEVLFIVKYVSFLRTNGIPIPRWRKRTIPRTAPEEDDFIELSSSEGSRSRYFIIEEVVSGGRQISREEASANPAFLTEAGRLLGKIHALSKEPHTSLDRLPAHYSFSEVLENLLNPGSLRLSATRLALAPDGLRLFDAAMQEIVGYWTPAHQKEFFSSEHRIASDLNFANLFFEADRPSLLAAVDWDQVRFGSPIEDIFATLVHVGRPEGGFHARTWREDLEALLEGYSESSGLSAAESDMLPFVFKSIMLHYIVILAKRTDVKWRRVLDRAIEAMGDMVRGVNPRSLEKTKHTFVERDLMFQTYDGKIAFRLAVSPAGFDASGRSTTDFDRVHNQIVLNGIPLSFGSAPDMAALEKTRTPVDDFRRFAPPDEELMALLPNGNLGLNDWFVGVSNGKVFYKGGEPLSDRTYDMLVLLKDGRINVMSLRFSQQREGWRILNEDGKDLSDEIVSAVYGQRIVKNGLPNLQAVAGQFDDIRHLFRLPLFFLPGKRQLHLGFSDDAGELYRDKEKVLHALRGEPVELSLEPLARHGISRREMTRVFAEWGYRRLKTLPAEKELRPGDYFIDASKDRLRISFLPGLHPHSFIGLNQKGQLIAGVVEGETHFAGLSLEKLAATLAARGAHDVFLWANGKDARLDGTDGSSAASDNVRRTYLEAILITRKTGEKAAPRATDPAVGEKNPEGSRDGELAADLLLGQSAPSSNGTRALLLPRLETPAIKQLAPGAAFVDTTAARLKEDHQYRQSFLEAFHEKLARAGAGRLSTVDAFWSLHCAVAASERVPGEQAAEGRPVQVIEEIVSREDLADAKILVNSLRRLNARDGETPVELRLIPAEPALENDLKRMTRGTPQVSVRAVALTAESLAEDFNTWRAQKNFQGVALRLAIGISRGVAVAGSPEGDSLYARALRAALSLTPPRPADIRKTLEIVEAIAGAA